MKWQGSAYCLIVVTYSCVVVGVGIDALIAEDMSALVAL